MQNRLVYKYGKRVASNHNSGISADACALVLETGDVLRSVSAGPHVGGALLGLRHWQPCVATRVTNYGSFILKASRISILEFLRRYKERRAKILSK